MRPAPARREALRDGSQLPLSPAEFPAKGGSTRIGSGLAGWSRTAVAREEQRGPGREFSVRGRVSHRRGYASSDVITCLIRV